MKNQRSEALIFDKNAFEKSFMDSKLSVTNGQLDFEEARLKDKLEERGSIEEHNNLTVGARFLDTHPLFYVVNGDKEDWEKD